MDTLARVDLGIIRDTVCERADLISLALEAGFRRARGRPKSWHCIHGEDRTPSAHLYDRGMKCFQCGGWWSAIDLVITAAGGCNFVVALRILADKTGVSWPDESLSSVDRDARHIAATYKPRQSLAQVRRLADAEGKHDGDR